VSVKAVARRILGLSSPSEHSDPAEVDRDEYVMNMIRAYLIDTYGFTVGEPEVPNDPQPPQVVVWGDDLFIEGCPDDDGRPRYYQFQPYIISDTREGSGIFKL
jgi:hypothetical protein